MSGGLAVVAAWAVLLWLRPPHMCPDGQTYLMTAAGVTPCRPFMWRIWPRFVRGVCVGEEGGTPVLVFSVWTQRVLLALQAVGVLVTALVLTAVGGWLAGMLWLGLPVARSQARWWPTGDAMAMALAVSCMVPGCPWWLLAVLGLLAGIWHERAPVFACLFSWSPWPLVGLLVPAAAALVLRPGAPHKWEADIVARPLASARHWANCAPLWVWVAPWGAVLVALAGPVSLQLLLVLAVAYGQCLIAVDRVRLYQWAAPVAVLAAVAVLPAWSWVLVAALHWAAPWDGEVRHA